MSRIFSMICPYNTGDIKIHLLFIPNSNLIKHPILYFRTLKQSYGEVYMASKGIPWQKPSGLSIYTADPATPVNLRMTTALVVDNFNLVKRIIELSTSGNTEPQKL